MNEDLEEYENEEEDQIFDYAWNKTKQQRNNK
jgi:hypothetical protein